MPETGNWIRYRFESNAFDSSTFQVDDFEGFERISTPYEFTINLVTEEPEIDLAALSQEGARLVMVNQDDEERTIHGVLAECHETGRGAADLAYYRVVLVPRLWLLSLQRQNQVHQEQDIAQTLEEELTQSGLAKNDDFEIRLTRSDYPVREYVVQYDETDLNFVCRQMEHYGIFFYFEQGDDKEKLIIADSNSAFPMLEGDSNIPFVPPSGQSAAREAVANLICTQNRMPEKVILNDYNHRTPSVGLKVEHPVSPTGKGIVSTYGDHFKTPGEGKILAEVRAQEILATEKLYQGTSSVIGFTAGAIYTLEEHPRSDVNGKSFLLTSVHHEGTQPGHSEENGGDAYLNTFHSILSDTAYRPPRETPKPKLYGVLNAKVDAAGSGEYAEVNDQGQYKVKLPFDLTGKGDAQASRFVRKAEPYAGPGYGQHFPLHSDCEVLLTCVDGDPDRPIIAGAVPNPEMASPVNGSNQKTSAIRTAGGNFIELDDAAGSERIKMTCPNSETYFHLGAANQGEPGMYASSSGLMNLLFGDDINTQTDANRSDTTLGDAYNTVKGIYEETVTGATKWTYENTLDWTIKSDKTTKTIGNTNSISIGTTKSLSVGDKYAIAVASELTETIGNYVALKQATSISHTCGLKASRDDSGDALKKAFRDESIDTYWHLTAVDVKHTFTGAYTCKAASAKLETDTTINLEAGSKVMIDGGGATIEVKAGEVNIKCGKLKVDGNLKVTGDAFIDGKVYDG